MIFKNVAAFIAARAAHRVLAGRPYFMVLDVTDPPGVISQALKEWDATTRCYAADPKTYDWDVRSLLIGYEAFKQSKPARKLREAMIFWAPLPEHITGAGRMFMHARAALVARLAKELTRRKVLTVDRVMAILNQRVGLAA